MGNSFRVRSASCSVLNKRLLYHFSVMFNKMQINTTLFPSLQSWKAHFEIGLGLILKISSWLDQSGWGTLSFSIEHAKASAVRIGLIRLSCLHTRIKLYMTFVIYLLYLNGYKGSDSRMRAHIDHQRQNWIAQSVRISHTWILAKVVVFTKRIMRQILLVAI